MKYFGRRLFEGIIFPLLISLFFSIVIVAGIYTNRETLAILSFILSVVYSIYELPKHLFAVRRRGVFYKTNFTVQVIVLAITVILGLFNLGDFYSFIFLQYTAFEVLGIPRALSALIVNSISALIILLTPKFAMKKKTQLDR